MKKRVDRRDGGLFGKSRTATERFGFEREQRPWTTAQEAVAVATTVACQSPDAYGLTSVPLLKAINHSPVIGPSANPSATRLQDTCVRAWELRVVTTIMGRHRGKTLSALIGFHELSRPRYSPLTWGERNRLIRPYYSLLTRGKPVITFDDLLVMTGRMGDPKPVEDFLLKLRGPKFTDDYDVTARPPVTEAKVGYLSILTKHLDGAVAVRAAGAVEMLGRDVWKLLTVDAVALPPGMRSKGSGQEDIIDRPIAGGIE